MPAWKMLREKKLASSSTTAFTTRLKIPSVSTVTGNESTLSKGLTVAFRIPSTSAVKMGAAHEPPTASMPGTTQIATAVAIAVESQLPMNPMTTP